MHDEKLDAILYLARYMSHIKTNMPVVQNQDLHHVYQTIIIYEWDPTAQMLIANIFTNVV